jgi:Fic family protein
MEILRFVGRHEGLASPRPEPRLRRQNRVRTIHGSLAIEGNTLSIAQITAILDGRRVAGPRRDIVEVQNAIAVYADAARLVPALRRDLLRAHRLMMRELIADAGRFRTGGVGVIHGSRVAHVAPPPTRVPELVDRVLDFVGRDGEVHGLVKSAVAHYEIEFIHPFSDGNGRMGRLWQHVILLRVHPLFEFIPVESVVRARQDEYYAALQDCDRAGTSTAFIEFSLRAILEALEDFSRSLVVSPRTSRDRLELAREHFASREFSRNEYRQLQKTISSATASRDLREGVWGKRLRRRGDKATARYRFARR